MKPISKHSFSASIMKKTLIPALLSVGIGSSYALTLAPATNTLPPLPADIPVKSLPNSAFKTPWEINLWKLLDLRAVEKEHAWRLFAALMQPVYDNNGETVRLFDTWHSLNEVVPPIGQPAIDFNPTNPSRHHSRLHFFDIPSQSAHLSPMMLAARTTKRGSLPFSEALVSDVKYNLPIAKWVKNQLMNTTTDASGTEVVASYNLMDKLVSGQAESLNFANIKGVMLKPAFTIVKHQGPTIIGRWEEKQGVVNPYSINSKLSPLNADTRVSSERTWVKEAVVYPPNTVGQPNPTYYGRDGTALDNPDVSGIPVFSVEKDFHYVQLTQAMVDSLKNGILSELMGPNIDNIEVGDYAVLTSMHIATREVDDWTWQTFWWQPIGGETLAQNGVPADLRTLFKKKEYAPLAHFRTGVGYDYTTPWTQEAIISSNPYLEGSFGLKPDLDAVFGPDAMTDGVNIFLRDDTDPQNPVPLSYNSVEYVHQPANGLATNCVTCHKAAAYPADSLGNLPASTAGIYPDYGRLTGQEDLFIGRLQTHFLWGVANKITEYSPPVAP